MRGIDHMRPYHNIGAPFHRSHSLILDLGEVLQNTWLIYRLCPTYIEKHLNLYEFRRDVCLTYFAMYSNKLNIERPLGKSKNSRVSEAIRPDVNNHHIVFMENNLDVKVAGKSRLGNVLNILHNYLINAFNLFL